MSDNTLPLQKFCELESKYGDSKVYLRQPLEGEWKTYTWKEVGHEARRMAAAIKRMNLPEKSCIALMSKNCAHWIITDLAIWMAGHISVPLYPTLSTDTIKHVLKHSEAKLFFVGKLDEWDKQRVGLDSGLEQVDFPFWKNEGCKSWDEFIGDAEPLQEVAEFKPSDISTIIYTSGTTGLPKGVVHTHDSISFPAREALKEVGLVPSDRFFSYLPLSHIAERLLVEIGSLYAGGTIYFAESLDTFAENLKLASPTVFLAVPRIWLKFQQGILGKLPQKKLSLLLSIPVVGNLIRKKIKTQLGLNDCRIPVTGAAPISKDLLLWFKNLGLDILEVYGMTENFGYATFNFPGRVQVGTVGETWKNGEVKIADNGEILTRSPATMQGYYKEPEKTAEVLSEDGWLRSGDKGQMDAQGFVRITGRVKDLFKTSKGKYIAPNPIEKHFSMSETIDQVCVLGAGLPQPFALVVPSEAGLEKDQDSFAKEMAALVENINTKVENFERLNKIVIVKDEWSVDTGLLTPTLKIKRNEVEKRYETKVDAWYNEKGNVIFAN